MLTHWTYSDALVYHDLLIRDHYEYPDCTMAQFVLICSSGSFYVFWIQVSDLKSSACFSANFLSLSTFYWHCKPILVNSTANFAFRMVVFLLIQFKNLFKQFSNTKELWGRSSIRFSAILEFEENIFAWSDLTCSIFRGNEIICRVSSAWRFHWETEFGQHQFNKEIVA